MATLSVRNPGGATGKTITSSDRVFGASVNKGLLYQAVRAEETNARQETRSTKTRGEVHHTTRKPYKQKGTGRARQGMTSAPHYRHGGIAMGPRPRDVRHELPKRMRRAAVAGALSIKASENAILVTDSVAMDVISTKQAAALLKSLDLTGTKVLIVLPEHSANVYKSFRNIQGVEVRFAPAFSTRDILHAQTILITEGALRKIEAAWGVTAEAEQAS